MRGPNWTDPDRGVTGESLVKNVPNYVTVIKPDGKRVTLVGEAAEKHRQSQQA